MSITEENVFTYIWIPTFVKHYCDVCASLAQKDCDVKLSNLFFF